MADIYKIKSTVLAHIKVLGGIFAVIAGFAGIYALFGNLEWALNNKYQLLFIAFQLEIILYMGWYILERKPPEYMKNPAVKKVMDQKNGNVILLVENAPWLSMGVMTSIHVLKDDFEVLLCVGEVINVQNNKNVQIQVVKSDYTNDSSKAESDNILKNHRNDLLIRPGLYRRKPE